MKRVLFLVLCLLPLVVESHEMIINTPEDVLILDIAPTESLESIEQKLALLGVDSLDECVIEFTSNRRKPWSPQTARTQGGYLGYPRNYSAEPTDVEKAHIHFIVTTLANRSLISLAFVQEELEARGDYIDHLHPFKFLQTVFTSEELKVGIKNICGKGWVWNRFIGGLKASLSTENSIGNITDEHIVDFCQKIGIHHNLILPVIRSSPPDWDEFFHLLIKHVPRNDDGDRYDC